MKFFLSLCFFMSFHSLSGFADCDKINFKKEQIIEIFISADDLGKSYIVNKGEAAQIDGYTWQCEKEGQDSTYQSTDELPENCKIDIGEAKYHDDQTFTKCTCEKEGCFEVPTSL